MKELSEILCWDLSARIPIYSLYDLLNIYHSLCFHNLCIQIMEIMYIYIYLARITPTSIPCNAYLKTRTIYKKIG
jgi:hypothetical protein